MKRFAADSLSMVLARRIGFMNSGRVLAFIVTWGMTCDELGRVPEVAEYSKRWGQSERTTYRELALFRKGLPGETDPARIWEQVRKDLPKNQNEGPAALGLVSSSSLRIAGL